MTRPRLLPNAKLPALQVARRSPQSSRIACRFSNASTCNVTRTATLLSRPRLFSASLSRPITTSSRRESPPASAAPPTAAPSELTDGKYHELADQWLENALVKFEDLQDEGQDIDVEYSSGVMTIRTEEKGTYVLNKQPPNKQIWLSSPISGPKRYDWTVTGDGQGGKEGTATGNWVYTRDQTTLDQLILEELGVDLETPMQG